MISSIDNTDITPYIDSRNELLINSLSEKEIRIGSIEGNSYACQFIDCDHSYVLVSSSIVSPAYFAHELLHVKMHDIDHGLYRINNSKFGISDRFYTHLVNTLEHRTMLPLFLELGYSEEEFLSNGNQRLISLCDIQSHKNNVDMILCDCCTVAGNCLSFYDYKTERNYLESNYTTCYQCVSDLITAWDSYISFEGGWIRFYYNGFTPFLRKVALLRG